MADSVNQSDNIADLSAALAKAQAEIKHANKDGENAFYKSRFAPLPSVFDAARPALTKNGLSVIQTTDVTPEGEVRLMTQLFHSTGQWIRSIFPIRPVKSDIQGYAATITMARRICYSAMVGVASDDLDDDGNMASGIEEQPKKNKPIFDNAALRNKFFSNVIDSFDHASNLEELEKLRQLNWPKLVEMKNGTEHDKLTYEEIYKQYQVYKSRFTNKQEITDSFGTGFADTPVDEPMDDEVGEPPENLWSQGAPVEEPEIVPSFMRRNK